MTTSSTFIDLRINNAEQLKESVSEPAPNTKLYLTYGKTGTWANDSNPPVSNTSYSTLYEVWRYMVGGKKITGADIHHIIPRNNWTANTVYTEYDDLNTDLFGINSKMTIVNNEYNVYKCIANNSGANSTIEPTSVNRDTIIETSDGYRWKFMYTISDSDKLRFVTDSYIPVQTLIADEGSIQWQVQEAAIDGAINYIKVTNGGSGYTNTSNILVTISGDGQSATATANINVTSQTVSSIIITDPGINYTRATVSISGGGGTNAAARAIISPPGGHGKNPIYELGGKDLMFNTRIIGSEGDILPVTNDYRQIAIIKDPLLEGTSNVSANAAFLQALTLITAAESSGDFIEDEIIYQGGTVDTATFKGVVLRWDSTNSTVYVINTEGTPAAGSITGEQSLTVRFLIADGIIEGDLEPHTGKILYVDNIGPISRAADQTEDFKIIIKF